MVHCELLVLQAGMHAGDNCVPWGVFGGWFGVVWGGLGANGAITSEEAGVAVGRGDRESR